MIRQRLQLKQLVFVLLISLPLLSGCVAVLVGAGVAGGIAASQDKGQLQVDCNFDRAFKTTHVALDRMGIINSEDKSSGSIEATLQESHVIARVVSVTAHSTRIEIKARKNLLPNIDLANKIINDINNRLHTSF